MTLMFHPQIGQVDVGAGVGALLAQGWRIVVKKNEVTHGLQKETAEEVTEQPKKRGRPRKGQ